ncbi:MAG: tRNA 2-selenouridine(34) synthase MnmH [Bacteroidota bacterium]
MIQPVKANEIFSLKSATLLVDVRSPAEFLQGHIPGAVNIPLFTDSERAEVGTRYKQAGRDAALLVGLDYVGSRMSGFVKKLHALCRGRSREVAVYCWRGGMRSASMAWLFSTAGYKVYLPEGGYKAYRSYIREISGKGVPMIVIGGMTGSGKTEILYELRKLGEQVIDLENLASNKGSVFGYLGQPEQPTNEQFENSLSDAWFSLDPSRPVWIEDESRSVGAVSLPGPFFENMKLQTMVLLQVPVEKRVERLMAEYAGFEKSSLTDALMKIAQPLGGQGVSGAVKSIEEGDFAPAIRLVLGYYDKMYRKALTKFSNRKIIRVESYTGNAAENAALILKHATGSAVT